MEELSAREVLIAWLEEPPVADPQEGVAQFNQVSADSLIAYLARHGFEIIKSTLLTSRPEH